LTHTKYFQLACCQMESIERLEISNYETGDQIISGDSDDLKKYITTYYKNLFGPLEENNFSLVQSRNGHHQWFLTAINNGF
jgi:hypothetical protein